jgi:hypothetical protein
MGLAPVDKGAGEENTYNDDRGSRQDPLYVFALRRHFFA